MSTIHIIMQGKGGVGKSLTSTFFAQYLQDQEKTVFCFDTDPVNQTFKSFAGLNVTFIPILENEVVNSRKFDDLMENILSIEEEDAHIVIDSGASSFISLVAYMIENKVIELLEEQKHSVRIHSVLVGGQGFQDTFDGLSSLIKSLDNAKFVIWQNHWFGPAEVKGKSFKDSSIYDTHKDRILGIINLEKFREETFGQDLSMMLSNNKTFAEAVNSADYTVMARQRLIQIKKKIFTAIAESEIL